jgi:hypothetical protein
MNQEATLKYLYKLIATLDNMQRQISTIRSELSRLIIDISKNKENPEDSDDDEFSLRMEGSRFF